MKITRVRQRVSKKSNHWLEVGNVVLSEEHKYIIESNTQCVVGLMLLNTVSMVYVDYKKQHWDTT